jgi:SAM-dependent methyltransferase
MTYIAPREESGGPNGAAYAGVSKLEALLGHGFFEEIQGRTVLDFGCGPGAEAIEMAQRGARRVLGVDIRESFLETARARAIDAGVADRCIFTSAPDEPADIVVSLDSFEHFDDPAEILRTMDSYLIPGGKVIASFGPPWYHPLGGHPFSIFPWAHLVLTEQTLLRWRKGFRPHQTARTITECGLNKMTVGRFERLIAESPFRFERCQIRAIHGHRWLTAPVVREFGTSVVTCTLIKRGAPFSGAGAPARPFTNLPTDQFCGSSDRTGTPRGLFASVVQRILRPDGKARRRGYREHLTEE